jgi:hypothetical protein
MPRKKLVRQIDESLGCSVEEPEKGLVLFFVQYSFKQKINTRFYEQLKLMRRKHLLIPLDLPKQSCLLVPVNYRYALVAGKLVEHYGGEYRIIQGKVLDSNYEVDLEEELETWRNKMHESYAEKK